MKKVYIAAPYTARHGRTVDDNLAYARAIAVEVARRGYFPLVPQLNTAHFEDDLPELSAEFWLLGTLAMMENADYVLMSDRWKQSSGAIVERVVAVAMDIPVVYSVDGLPEYLDHEAIKQEYRELVDEISKRCDTLKEDLKKSDIRLD